MATNWSGFAGTLWLMASGTLAAMAANETRTWVPFGRGGHGGLGGRGLSGGWTGGRWRHAQSARGPGRGHGERGRRSGPARALRRRPGRRRLRRFRPRQHFFEQSQHLLPFSFSWRCHLRVEQCSTCRLPNRPCPRSHLRRFISSRRPSGISRTSLSAPCALCANAMSSRRKTLVEPASFLITSAFPGRS